MTNKTYPADYVPPFTEDDIRRRFQFLSEQCQNYVDAIHDVHSTWRLRIDPLVMLSVAQSAMDDIWRYKSYHLRDPDKRSNAIKRAAYLTKWITRFRPIYVARILSANNLGATFDKKDTTLLVNEGFAIHISLTTLATSINVEEIHLEPDFFADFLYDLHYRSYSEDALLAMYDVIRNFAKGGSVILKVIKD
ncbi:MAG: hypothetical protein A3G18_09570 [Rhodospirillales bacterium RIFCSPLOWO2_12_FULL_58_28]|nr:MAG: hypothetical protein A3H92_02105 [Rhodospirillales bacterium RIFCSPLOWO2_02_FULL_58_16]OHC76750.1 MAG: hypothetical protein A3G18_09570 [Rhodospirillales bacterium RIFCSPLOWO2_12_FULL_58_28]